MRTQSSHSITSLVGTYGIVTAILLGGMGAPALGQYLTVVGAPLSVPGGGAFGGGDVASLDDLGAVGYVNKFDASSGYLGAVPFRWSINESGTEIQWNELGILGNQAADPTGLTGGYAKAMDGAGNVIGHVVDRDNNGSMRHRAVRWNAGGTTPNVLANLGMTPYGNTWGGALDVNTAGDIVGFAEKYNASGLSQGWRALRWDASGTMTELGTLDASNSAGAFAYNGASAVNDAGTAIGAADKYDASGTAVGQRAVRWDPGNTTPIELANLGTDANGFTDTWATAINSAGVIVGSARKPNADGTSWQVAAQWDASGAIIELESLSTDRHLATDINDANIAIGSIIVNIGGGRRAVRWDASGAATELKSPLGDLAITDANDINNAGVVVGSSWIPPNNDLSKALYWGVDGVPVDLNTLIDPASGWTLTSAHAINDTGWIGGLGRFDPDGPGRQVAVDRLFLMRLPLAAVPEPGTSALALLGLGSLLLLRQRSPRRPDKFARDDFRVTSPPIRSNAYALLAILMSLSAAAPTFAASLTPLGDLPGGSFYSWAGGVSADGSVVVGQSSSAAGPQAFRWTRESGMVGLGYLPCPALYEPFSQALGVSADGSVIVGESTSPFGREAVRWTSGGGAISLGDLPEGTVGSQARGVSDDGEVVVGYGIPQSNDQEVVRWTPGGGIETLADPGFTSRYGWANGASADGSVVVGLSVLLTIPPRGEAFRWTSGTGLVGLGFLPGGTLESEAYAVSADGSVIVGYSSTASGDEAFRWTPGGGMVGLGVLPGTDSDSVAYDVSGDGSIIVGFNRSPVDGFKALYWSEDGGMQTLWDVLLSHGVDPASDGWTHLHEARAISADGSTIVGVGTRNGNDEAFVAVLSAPVPEPAAGALALLGASGLLLLRRHSLPGHTPAQRQVIPPRQTSAGTGTNHPQ